MPPPPDGGGQAALDDVSATEWRTGKRTAEEQAAQLHSMMSVLPNGGTYFFVLKGIFSKLHSMMSVLPNGG